MFQRQYRIQLKSKCVNHTCKMHLFCHNFDKPILMVYPKKVTKKISAPIGAWKYNFPLLYKIITDRRKNGRTKRINQQTDRRNHREVRLLPMTHNYIIHAICAICCTMHMHHARKNANILALCVCVMNGKRSMSTTFDWVLFYLQKAATFHCISFYFQKYSVRPENFLSDILLRVFQKYCVFSQYAQVLP